MEYILKLYIAGETTRSSHAIDNIKIMVADYLDNKAKVEIIDVLEEPQKAVNAGINATPTIVKHFPEPVKKSIADLANIKEILFWLGINK